MMNNSNLAMNMAANPADHLQNNAARSFARKYSESLRYAGVGGTDIPYQEQLTRAVDYDQGPVMGEKLIAGPSFSNASGPLAPYFEQRTKELRNQLA